MHTSRFSLSHSSNMYRDLVMEQVLPIFQKRPPIVSHYSKSPIINIRVYLLVCIHRYMHGHVHTCICTYLLLVNRAVLQSWSLTLMSHLCSRKAGAALNEAWKLQKVLPSLFPFPPRAFQTLWEPGFCGLCTQEPPPTGS